MSIRNCLAVHACGVGKKKKRRVLVKRGAVGRAEQQWNHQRPVWILEIHPFWTAVSLEGCHLRCAPFFLAWRAPVRAPLGNTSGLSEGRIPDLSFSGATFLVHTEYFMRLISGYIKMFLLSSAPQWPSKLQWVISYFQMAVVGYIQLQEKERDVMQGAWLTVAGKETRDSCTDILLPLGTTGCATSQTKIAGSQMFNRVVATPAAGLPSPEETSIQIHLKWRPNWGYQGYEALLWIGDGSGTRILYLLHYLLFNSDCTFLACSFYRQSFLVMAV